MDKALYENQWQPPDPHYNLALALWCRYYVECERFDRRVCSGRMDDGTAIPIYDGEVKAVQTYALHKRREIMDEALSWNVLIHMDTAKHEALHLSEAVQIFYMERIDEFKEIVNDKRSD